MFVWYVPEAVWYLQILKDSESNYNTSPLLSSSSLSFALLTLVSELDFLAGGYVFVNLAFDVDWAAESLKAASVNFSKAA